MGKVGCITDAEGAMAERILSAQWSCHETFRTNNGRGFASQIAANSKYPCLIEGSSAI